MILVILAHPNFDKSVANSTIINELKKSNLELEIRDIHSLYPDYKIDVKAEQEALLRHQTIVFQCPFYWLNIPAILKIWFEEVFEYQFAYGSKGDKLKDKNFILSSTVGAGEKEYKLVGKHHRDISEFIKNIEQTAYGSQMNYLPPTFLYSSSLKAGNLSDEVSKRAKEHAKKLITRLTEINELSKTSGEIILCWLCFI